MKKNYIFILLLLLCSEFATSQVDYFNAPASSNGTSPNARAPQGSRRYARSVYLIPQTEMAQTGIVNGNVINSIAFNYLTAQDVQTTGNLVLYL